MPTVLMTDGGLWGRRKVGETTVLAVSGSDRRPIVMTDINVGFYVGRPSQWAEERLVVKVETMPRAGLRRYKEGWSFKDEHDQLRDLVVEDRWGEGILSNRRTDGISMNGGDASKEDPA